MELFPAIDLQNGICVRLERGDFDTATPYDTDPALAARRFQAAGAAWLHIVDLDGAKDGAARQTSVIKRIADNTGLKIQAGGGLRSHADIETLFRAGVTRVVIGSLAVENPDLVCAWIETFGRERIVIALDVRIDETGVPRALTRGWQDQNGQSLWDILAAYKSGGLRTLLCTDVSRDGMLSGPNLSLYREILQRFPALDLLASGGIAALDDLRALAALPCAGAVTGKALYENKFDLMGAIALVKESSNAG